MADDARNSGGEAGDDPVSRLVLSVAQHRDRKAFAELFRHFAPRLKAYVMRAGADPATAEEIAQETMLSVWRRADTFDPARASAATWVFTIARNRRIDALRRERWHDPLPEGDDSDIGADPAPADDLERAHTFRQVARTIDGLPREQATVLQMAYLEAKPQARIAEELALPIGTVKSRIRLGLEKMRTMMGGMEP